MEQLKNTTSISKLAAAVLAVTFLVASCKMDVIDQNSQRTRLGDIQIAIAGTDVASNDIEVRGRIIESDPNRDSIYTNPRLSGTYKHYIVLDDSTRRDTVYYTLPVPAKIKSDTVEFVLIYKKMQNRVALLLKTKSDSLVCLMGTLLPQELAWLPTKAGHQNIRVLSGNEAVATRITDCGREGDFNAFFHISESSANVKPAQTGVLLVDERAYLVANIANTSLIKNTNSCPETVGEFVYVIMQQ